MTADQLVMIATDPRVIHGLAVIAGTCVPVSVILDCLAAGMTAEKITSEYPTVTIARCARPPPTAQRRHAGICFRRRSRDDVRPARDPSRHVLRQFGGFTSVHVTRG